MNLTFLEFNNVFSTEAGSLELCLEQDDLIRHLTPGRVIADRNIQNGARNEPSF